MSRRSLVVPALLASVTLLVPASLNAGSPQQQAELVSGHCSVMGASVTQLGGLVPGEVPDDAPPELASAARALGAPVAIGQGTVPLALQDIVQGDHAVRVVMPAGSGEEVLACGEFATVDGTVDDLHVGLVGGDGSGIVGVAWLHDNADGTTSASIVLSTLAQAVSGPTDDVDLEVAIRKSLYDPNPLEVVAGTTVTWINEDALPHTTTSVEGGFDSGYMPLDARFSYTFDEPGEYPIFCVYHPRMRSVVIVS